MSVLDTLVTDRTLADVENLRMLRSKGWQRMTPEEQAAYMDSRGAYNASDLNRVGEAVTYLAEKLVDTYEALRAYADGLMVGWDDLYEVPYDPEEYGFTGKTDWTRPDIPTPEQLAEYLDKVKKLRAAIEYETDTLPDSMLRLTHTGANAIERALLLLDGAIDRMEAEIKEIIDRVPLSFIYSDEAFSGEF